MVLQGREENRALQDKQTEEFALRVELLDDQEERSQERIDLGLLEQEQEQVVDNDSEVVDGVNTLVISPMTLRRRRSRVMLDSSEEEFEDDDDAEWFVAASDLSDSDD